MAEDKPAEGGSSETAEALAALALTQRAARAFGRPDLADRLEATRERSSDPSFRTLIVGEYKQGKSTLIDALLNAPVCPVDEDIATAVPTVVRYAETFEVVAHYDLGPEGGFRSVEVPPEQLSEHVTEARLPTDGARPHLVTVGVPRRLLAGGLELVDTPGVGGLGSAHAAVTIGALPMADAVIFVSDASQEYSASEIEFLSRARSSCPTIVAALTKVDVYPEWKKIARLNREHLRECGIAADLIPLAAPLRELAVREEDAELNDESGYPALVAWLRQMNDQAERLTVRSIVNDALWVCSQLESTFGSELRVLDDPQRVEQLVTELEHAKMQAEDLRSRSARWQQTLYDGVADLTADIDHDLRERTRQIMRVAEEAIDSSDPKETWEEFQQWLSRRAAFEFAENYSALAERTRELTLRVAEHFGDGEDAARVPLEIDAPTQLAEEIEVRGSMAKGTGPGGLGLTAMRGAYGSILMFGMLGNMIGLAAAIANPLTAGATLLLGRKAIRDQRDRELQTRRQQARAAVRQYLDDVSFQVGKDSRDALRRIQRALRDRFTERAEDLQRSTQEALSSAQRSLQVDEAERKERIQSVRAELDRVGALRKRLFQLSPELAGAPS